MTEPSAAPQSADISPIADPSRLPQVPPNPFPPGSILTPEDVSQGLMELTDRLERGTRFLHAKIEEADEADEKYQFALAEALFESAARNEGQRKAEAMTKCREQFHNRRVLMTTVKTTQERLKTLRVMIEAGRSIGAAVRIGYNEGQQPGR